jgi:biopolymer transport protein ExbD
MQFKNKHNPSSQVPQVNLVPMMDVLMTVLTFFIIISMTLTGEAVNVFLPRVKETGNGDGGTSAPTLVIGLNTQEQILLRNQSINVDQMIQEIQTFLQQNPEGIVILKADRELTYRQVASLLKTMRDIGGGRVSLGIETE